MKVAFKLCSKIIMMNKVCKNDKLLLVTELFFSNNLKANGKILLGFFRGNQGYTNFRFGLQIYIITSALYLIKTKCIA